MRSPLAVIIFLLFMVALDFYFFRAVKTVSQDAEPRTKQIIAIVFWSLSILVIVSFLVFVFTDQEFLGKKFRTYLFAIIVGLFLAKLIAMVFFLVDDLRRAIQWIAAKLFFSNTEGEGLGADGISRSVFLSWIGIAAGGTLFGSLLYGFSNKYNYDIKRVKLSFANLPPAFKGFKILHFSDVHSGSLLATRAVDAGVQKILNENADIILFSGDLVNNQATEMTALKKVFGKLNAPMGVYSTLGNHDYGDYVQWPVDGVSKDENLENLKTIHADMGWRLLMNEHVVLERGEDKIALLGIENWSAKANFPRYGKMEQAHPGTEQYPFKVLISHDPSHWDAQVLKEYPDIDLMLSGHTHGMQFGVELPGFKWSPVQYMYKQWAGLYERGNQKLYVNRGFGFIGYPGRVGVLPEITVIELT